MCQLAAPLPGVSLVPCPSVLPPWRSSGPPDRGGFRGPITGPSGPSRPTGLRYRGRAGRPRA
jgi:hypothetical protein